MALRFIIFLASAAFITTSHLVQYKQTSAVFLNNFVEIYFTKRGMVNSIVSDLQPINVTIIYKLFFRHRTYLVMMQIFWFH